LKARRRPHHRSTSFPPPPAAAEEEWKWGNGCVSSCQSSIHRHGAGGDWRNTDFGRRREILACTACLRVVKLKQGVKVENRDSGAQKREAVMQWLADHGTALRRRGYVVQTWREYCGRRLGPYYRLRYREQGRERSVYLGRDAALAEDVHRRLRDMQAPRRAQREADRRYKAERAVLRRLKARWEGELRKIGLRLKGFEVRGPVRACLRRAFSNLVGHAGHAHTPFAEPQGVPPVMEPRAAAASFVEKRRSGAQKRSAAVGQACVPARIVGRAAVGRTTVGGSCSRCTDSSFSTGAARAVRFRFLPVLARMQV
jgi:hypothetical protein